MVSRLNVPWDDLFLQAVDRPGQWVTIAERSTHAELIQTRHNVWFKVQHSEVDPNNFQSRFRQQGDRHLLQVRYLPSVGTPRYLNVTLQGKPHVRLYGISEIDVVPHVVSQLTDEWGGGDRRAIILVGRSTAYPEHTMRWALPREIAMYLRLALNHHLT